MNDQNMTPTATLPVDGDPVQLDLFPRFIVMTSAASTRGKWSGKYANVAVVETDMMGRPKFIGEKARHLVSIRWYGGGLFVGRTDRCEYRAALAWAEMLAAELNAAVGGGA